MSLLSASPSQFTIGIDDNENDQKSEPYNEISTDTQNSLYNAEHTNNEQTESEFSFETEYKAIEEIIETEHFYSFQHITHKMVYPLLSLCDHSIIRKRPWLHIPFIKYMTRITSMIIGIALSQLVIKGYELKSSHSDISTNYEYLNDVIYFLGAYLLLICIISISFLYLYYHYHAEINYRGFSIYHYHYFVVCCSGIIGFAVLYLLIHIQSQSYSSSISASIQCLFGSFMFAISFCGVIIFVKQFVFDFNWNYNRIQDEYDTDEDMDQLNPLLMNDNVSNSEYHNISSSPTHSHPFIDNNEFIIDRYMDSDETMLTEFKEKGCLWFTISGLSLDIWHIALGLVLIECVLYMFNGSYINLLIDWTHDSDSKNINNHKWNLVAFGLILAFATGIIQIAMQIYCKSPLYNYQCELMQNQEYNPSNNVLLSTLSTLPHKEDIILFLLNWLNDIGVLWNKVLSASIGWSLLTPNGTDSISIQFMTASAATFLFLFVGYVLSDYKRRIQKDILTEIRDLKRKLMINKELDFDEKVEEINGNNGNTEYDADGLMNRIVFDKQKLIFLDQLQETYDLAFAVSVSYSWESFLAIFVTKTYGGNELNRFISHLVLTVFVAFVFSQFGLELVDLKRQRLREAKNEQKRLRRESYYKVRDVDIEKKERSAEVKEKNEEVKLQICDTGNEA